MAHKILILDDDLQVRDSLAIALEDEGFAIEQAGSSEEALAFLEQELADLVIVDLRLPGMDGLRFIVVAKEKCPGLKFIVYTGSPEFQVPSSLVSDPNVSNTIFLKPIHDFDSLVDEIHRLL